MKERPDPLARSHSSGSLHAGVNVGPALPTQIQLKWQRCMQTLAQRDCSPIGSTLFHSREATRDTVDFKYRGSKCSAGCLAAIPSRLCKRARQSKTNKKRNSAFFFIQVLNERSPGKGLNAVRMLQVRASSVVGCPLGHAESHDEEY